MILASRYQHGLAAALLAILLGACSGDSGEGPTQPGAQPLEAMEPEQLMRLAERFQRAGDAGTALRFYSRAAEKAPENPAPLVGIGDLHLGVGELQRAGAAYAEALARDPNHEEATLGLVRAVIRSGQPKSALDRLEGLPPAETADSAAERANLEGVARDLLSQHSAAREAYARALSEDGEDSDVTTNLALSLAVSGEHAGAMDVLRDLEESRDTRPMARENLALVLAMAGRVNDAVATAATVLPEETARGNRAFYSQLATLEGPALTRAVFLGKLPDASEATVENRPDKQTPSQERETGRSTPPETTVSVPALPGPIVPPGEPSKDDDADPVDAEAVAVTEAQPIESGEKTDAGAEAKAEAESQSQSTYHLQLASFPRREQLRTHWRSIADSPALAEMSPLRRRIEEDESAMYRLLVGPITGYESARAACQSLLETEIDCVVMPEQPDTQPLNLDAMTDTTADGR